MSPVRETADLPDITRTHWGVLIARLEEVATSIAGIAQDDCLTRDEETALLSALEEVRSVAGALRDEAKR